MHLPNLQQLDNIRTNGFRPQVVGCFLHEQKVLFTYHKDFDLWSLPQGGIENGESIEAAFAREMTEELGPTFMAVCSGDLKLLGSDQMVFPESTQGSRPLATDEGEDVHMKGKYYFFVAIQIEDVELDISETEFEQVAWLNYNQAQEVARTIYQAGKQRITVRALELLRKADLL